ncbi:cytochrome c-type biogenesis protein [Kordiimonas marina]|uniref:cytochrome c-type biogenesis protein n=1 Tax=Kordiimonas marina TaxID=2872312 RepID=UPI001FF35A91|nr:cytochrome c-type biogenesis protein [Kordiimonas marina]MCJ9428108.1 cytochrome c-type biogenesis protein CcmH [Kordiimonas marina]
MKRLMVFILCLAFSAPAFAVVADKPLADPAKEAVARSLMKEIRCLVCQNESIDESDADLAKDLRGLIREHVAKGDSPKQIRQFLVDRYGDWVLLKPPVQPSTYLLWGSPFLFLILGGIAVMRRRVRANAPEPLSAEEEAKLKKLLRSKGDKA